jgi:hypothetical protein
VLTDQPWANVWEGLLNLNSSHDDVQPDPSHLEPADDALYYVQNSIEDWAAEKLPSINSTLMGLESSAAAGSEEFTADSTQQLCYGMVCLSSPCGYSPLSTSHMSPFTILILSSLCGHSLASKPHVPLLKILILHSGLPYSYQTRGGDGTD